MVAEPGCTECIGDKAWRVSNQDGALQRERHRLRQTPGASSCGPAQAVQRPIRSIPVADASSRHHVGDRDRPIRSQRLTAEPLSASYNDTVFEIRNGTRPYRICRTQFDGMPAGGSAGAGTSESAFLWRLGRAARAGVEVPIGPELDREARIFVLGFRPQRRDVPGGRTTVRLRSRSAKHPPRVQLPVRQRSGQKRCFTGLAGRIYIVVSADLFDDRFAHLERCNSKAL
jgi:hypothetical protein